MQSPPSSAESDQDNPGLPVVNDNSVDRVMGHAVSRPGATMRLPPLPSSPPMKMDRTNRLVLMNM